MTVLIYPFASPGQGTSWLHTAAITCLQASLFWASLHYLNSSMQHLGTNLHTQLNAVDNTSAKDIALSKL